MDTKGIVNDLNAKLKYGDKAKISTKTGLSKSVVYQFFENSDYPISQDSIEKLVKAACELIKDREERAEGLTKLVAEL